MRSLINILVASFLCLTYQQGSTQLWVNDNHKQAIQRTDAIKDNALAHKILDSIRKLPGLSPRSKTETLMRLAMVQVKMQKLDEASRLSFEGIELAEKHQFDTAHATFYKIIGAINYYASKYPEAIKYFGRSAALAKQKGILYLEVINYQNMGAVFMDSKKNDSSEMYLKKAIDLSKNCGSKCNVSRITAYRLLATLYERQQKYREALILYQAGEKEARQLNDTTLISSYLVFSAELFSKTNNLKRAIANAEEAVKLMRLHKGRNEHSFYFALGFLAKKMDTVGRYKEASALKQEAMSLQQMMSKTESQQQVNELETKFKVKEIEQEKNIANANALAQSRKKELLLLALAFVLLLAVSIAVLAFFRNKKKQAEAKVKEQQAIVAAIVEAEEKERSRIAKDLHDGIVQDLTAIKMGLKSSAQSAPETLQQQLSSILHDVDAATKEVREISYQMMPVTLKELGLLQAIQELLNRSLGKNSIQFDFDNFGIEQRLPEKIEVTVYRICQELINNTIKHSGATQVSLLLQLRSNVLQLTYEDNGKGFNPSNIKKGIGLNSLDSRIEMVKGSLEIDASPEIGTTAYIRIPL